MIIIIIIDVVIIDRFMTIYSSVVILHYKHFFSNSNYFIIIIIIIIHWFQEITFEELDSPVPMDVMDIVMEMCSGALWGAPQEYREVIIIIGFFLNVYWIYTI